MILVRRRDWEAEINRLLRRLRNLPPYLRHEIAKCRAALKAFAPSFENGSLGMEGVLRFKILRQGGEVEDYGVVSRRVITRSGVDLIVKGFAGVAGNDVSAFRFHGLGGGTTSESSTDTALVSEFTTQTSPPSTRATGTQGNPAPVGDDFFYETVGTTNFSSSATVNEHGIFNQAAVPGGVLLDRSVVAPKNLGPGEALVSTYTLRIGAGG